MDWIIFLFGSGAVYFIGIALIFFGLAIVVWSGRQLFKILATLSTVFGLILIALSATPLPYWLYAVAIGASLIWLASERFHQERLVAARRGLRILVGTVWTLCAVVEIPHCMIPTVWPQNAAGHPILYVIGDSVSAGMSNVKKDNWPLLLARAHPVEVVDLSRIGATTTSAMQQAEGLPAEGGLVLVEIGGNDLLGTTPAKQYEHDLDLLLGRICISPRKVVMFELPLPPFENEYGRIQRALAAKYGVPLIPKRVFVSVLSQGGTTLDSIHLSPSGHEKMAEVVWSVIRPAYGD